MPYPNLYRFAETLAEQWLDPDSVDFEKANDLVSDIVNIPQTDRTEAMERILQYATATSVWDQSDVAQWPSVVMDELSNSDKQYRYRPDGEHWEMFGVYASGEEDWVATVSTQSVAERLIRALDV